jgi:hypothetical protein
MTVNSAKRGSKYEILWKVGVINDEFTIIDLLFISPAVSNRKK